MKSLIMIALLFIVVAFGLYYIYIIYVIYKKEKLIINVYDKIEDISKLLNENKYTLIIHNYNYFDFSGLKHDSNRFKIICKNRFGGKCELKIEYKNNKFKIINVKLLDETKIKEKIIEKFNGAA